MACDKDDCGWKNPPRPTRAILRPLPASEGQRSSWPRPKDVHACVRPSAAVIAAAAGVGEGSCPCLTAYIDSTILALCPLLAPSKANLTLIHTATLPACEHGLIPRALDRPWTRPYETSRAILRHSLVRPVASIATSATRSPTKDCTHGGRPSACPLDYARAAGTGLCIILEGLCQ